MTATANNSIPFFILDAAGNRFFAAAPTGNVDAIAHDFPRLAQKFCRQHNLEGAFFLRQKAKDRIQWFFYNRDGSPAEMCGNAARCAALVAEKLGWAQRGFVLETLSGLITVDLSAAGVEVHLALMKPLGAVVPIEGLPRDTLLVQSGVPHLVIPFSGGKPDRQVSQGLRSHPALGQSGANVTWVFPVGKGQVQAITFERGVEDFTAACGTGAVAAAIWMKRFKGDDEVHIDMPGGQLRVRIDQNETEAVLTGPSEIKSLGQMDQEEFFG